MSRWANVSRVLNNHNNVSEETCVLALQAAQALGYPLPDPQRGQMVFRTVLGADDPGDGEACRARSLGGCDI